MANYPFRLDSELIIISVKLENKIHSYNGKFVLDTGSSAIIIDHEVALDLGYSARDGVGFSTVRSAVGKESGYRLVVENFEALGHRVNTMEVRCHDLKEQGVEGLVGMSFLKHFDWCVHPKAQIISVK